MDQSEVNALPARWESSTDRVTLGSGGSKGGRSRRAPPPTARNFLIFMQFLGQILQKSMLAPPPRELAPPPTGNPGSAPAWGNKRLIFPIKY